MSKMDKLVFGIVVGIALVQALVADDIFDHSGDSDERSWNERHDHDWLANLPED